MMATASGDLKGCLQKGGNMKLFVIIPGFGEGNWDAKVDILRKNVATVEAFFDDYTFRIVQYTMDKELPPDIVNNPKINIVKDVGILGRNLYVHAHPNTVSADYIMLILDDVELQAPFPWKHVIDVASALNLDIASPVLTSKSMTVWNFMTRMQDSHIIASVMSRCELFCYIMTPRAYEKYYAFTDPMNPWMWGMDFMLHSHMNLRVGLIQNAYMKHHFWRTSPTHDPKHDPSKDLHQYLAKYDIIWDELHKMPSILEIASTQ